MQLYTLDTNYKFLYNCILTNQNMLKYSKILELFILLMQLYSIDTIVCKSIYTIKKLNIIKNYY